MGVLNHPLLVVFALLLAGWLAVRSGKIDGPGAAVGCLLAGSTYVGVGWTGPALLLLFFALGSGASQWGVAHKRAAGLAEPNAGRRSVANVLANGGTAAACGLLAAAFPTYTDFAYVALTASLASATADTLASELGNLYGRRYVDILTGRAGRRGDDGVVSLEGTLWGAAGSAVVATAALAGGLPALGWGAVALAGVLGNAVDSWLGATAQRWGYLGNHGVNFLNTLAAAGVGGGLYAFLR